MMRDMKNPLIHLRRYLQDNKRYRQDKQTGKGISDLTKPRIVLIVGAGASHAADSLPMGDELAELIERDLSDRIPDYPRRLDAEIQLLSKIHDLTSRRNFRTIAFASGKIDRNRTIEVVQRNLYSCLQSNFTYEAIARLLCSGAIDAVISFNFDELFDRALSRIDVNQRTLRICSDKDCPPSLMPMLSFSEKHIPIYIKAHGTLSDENTLRFARQDSHRFQPAISKSLSQLFAAPDLKVITVGFRLKFPELSMLLLSSATSGMELFLIDKTPDILDDRLRDYPAHFIGVTEERDLDAIFRILTY
jgi:hypothetical protein